MSKGCIGAFLLVMTGLSGQTARAEIIVPRHDMGCVLQKLAEHLRMPLRTDIPLPKLSLESRTVFSHFQDAMEPQWKMRPDTFTNAFAADLNEIFLLDDTRWYRNGRKIDDSLAHELTHYIQVKYRGWKVEELDDSAEMEAISEQTWFREAFEGGANLPPVPAMKDCAAE